MSDEKLICSICNKKILILPENNFTIWRFECSGLITECPLDGITIHANSESEAIAAFKKATRANGQGFCEWSFNKADSRWGSSCNQSFCFFESDPKEFHYKFCPYCGKKLTLPELKP